MLPVLSHGEDVRRGHGEGDGQRDRARWTVIELNLSLISRREYPQSVNFDLVNIRDKNKKVSDDKNEEKNKSLTDNVSVKCPQYNYLFSNNTEMTKHMKIHYSSFMFSLQ